MKINKFLNLESVKKIIFLSLVLFATNSFGQNNTSVKENSSAIKVSDLIEHPYQMNSTAHTPIKFQPDIVSTLIDKYNTSFSPDSKTIYYTVTSQKLGITGIAFQEFKDGGFASPVFAPFFSQDIPMTDVQISPDGSLMLFSTFKDYMGKPDGFNFNIWTSELKEDKWQKPKPIGAPISSTGNEFYPVMTNNKTIYFTSDKEGNSDIYFSKFNNGEYQEPIKLPNNINSEEREADAFIARDESYIIFVRVDQPDGFGNSDLYISFRISENEWTDPINMGSNVNSNQVDGSPYVTPDGKYLIFTSGRLENGTKEKASRNYLDFKRIISSSDNGSLNFYIMDLNLEKYK